VYENFAALKQLLAGKQGQLVRLTRDSPDLGTTYMDVWQVGPAVPTQNMRVFGWPLKAPRPFWVGAADTGNTGSTMTPEGDAPIDPERKTPLLPSGSVEVRQPLAEAVLDRALGDDVHDSGDRVGSVEDRCGSAHDFDLLDGVEVYKGGKLAEVSLTAGVVHANSVGEHQNALTALAPDLGPNLVHPHTCHVQAREGAEEIGDGVRRLLDQILAPNDRHRYGHRRSEARASRGRHDHGIYEVDEGIGGPGPCRRLSESLPGKRQRGTDRGERRLRR
jgi:hypothetical protein